MHTTASAKSVDSPIFDGDEMPPASARTEPGTFPIRARASERFIAVHRSLRLGAPISASEVRAATAAFSQPSANVRGSPRPDSPAR